MIDKWIFKPTESIGSITFGMERNEVRKLFSCECKEFRKNKYSKNTTDDFGKFHVYYNEENKVEAVEVFEGIEIILEDKTLYPSEISNIISLLGSVEEEYDSYTSYDYSVGIYAPDKEVESIIFAEKGYFE